MFQCTNLNQVVYRNSNTPEYFLRILLRAPGDLLSPSCSGILSSLEINEVSVSAAGFAFTRDECIRVALFKSS
jgi:hypothetical protein